MTKPRPEALEREKDKLFLTNIELIKRLGGPDKTIRPVPPASLPEVKTAFRAAWDARPR